VAVPESVASALASAVLPVKPQANQSFTNGTGIVLQGCPAGIFTMGSPDSEKERRANEDQHKVTVTGFWLGKFEVTQAEWTAVMGRNPASRKGPGKPVEMVNWDDATEFCRRLTDRERARGTLPPGWGYTLPTDAQWEYACRAGTTTAWSFGDDPGKLCENGNYNDITGNFPDNDTEHDDKEEYTAVVGRFKANPWGFHDMHGNVWEWCADWYEQNLGTDAVTDPTGPPSGSFRVNRGGSFNNPASICRSAFRVRITPSNRSNDLGFRVAAVLIPSSPGGKSANGGTE
jgi:formylglycine-generating enzyme required for sulfatase activity